MGKEGDNEAFDHAVDRRVVSTGADLMAHDPHASGPVSMGEGEPRVLRLHWAAAPWADGWVPPRPYPLEGFSVSASACLSNVRATVAAMTLLHPSARKAAAALRNVAPDVATSSTTRTAGGTGPDASKQGPTER